MLGNAVPKICIKKVKCIYLTSCIFRDKNAPDELGNFDFIKTHERNGDLEIKSYFPPQSKYIVVLLEDSFLPPTTVSVGVARAARLGKFEMEPKLSLRVL